MLILKAELLGIYKANDFKDKTTGEITIGNTRLLLLGKRTLKNDSIERIMFNIVIPNKKANLYTEDKIGKEVEVDIDVIGEVKYMGI